MAVSHEELHDSRPRMQGGGNPSAELHYHIRGTADDTAALTEAYAASPATHDGLIRDTVHLTPVFIDENNSDACVWRAKVAYKAKPRLVFPSSAAGTIRIYGEVGGATAHITQALATTAYPAASAPDRGGAIGYDGQSVQGVDVGVGGFRFRVVKTFDTDEVPAWTTLYAAAWHVNDDAWSITDSETGQTLSFAAREVLLEGVAWGDARSDDTIEYTYTFDAKPTVTNRTIGAVTGVNAYGHDVIDVYYEDDVATADLIKVPKYVYVHQVYPAAAFGGIGL